jgi:hypothetical protein
MSYDMVSVYTLMIGDETGPATVGVHASAEEAWRALDREVRVRAGLRARPRRVPDAESATRLANAWKSGDPEHRFWQLRPHRLPIMIPEIGRPEWSRAADPRPVGVRSGGG